jgi:hypothetical protein
VFHRTVNLQPNLVARYSKLDSYLLASFRARLIAALTPFFARRARTFAFKCRM